MSVFFIVPTLIAVLSAIASLWSLVNLWDKDAKLKETKQSLTCQESILMILNILILALSLTYLGLLLYGVEDRLRTIASDALTPLIAKARAGATQFREEALPLIADIAAVRNDMSSARQRLENVQPQFRFSLSDRRDSPPRF
jgi:hypothetical protein